MREGTEPTPLFAQAPPRAETDNGQMCYNALSKGLPEDCP